MACTFVPKTLNGTIGDFLQQKGSCQDGQPTHPSSSPPATGLISSFLDSLACGRAEIYSEPPEHTFSLHARCVSSPVTAHKYEARKTMRGTHKSTIFKGLPHSRTNVDTIKSCDTSTTVSSHGSVSAQDDDNSILDTNNHNVSSSSDNSTVWVNMEAMLLESDDDDDDDSEIMCLGTNPSNNDHNMSSPNALKQSFCFDEDDDADEKSVFSRGASFLELVGGDDNEPREGVDEEIHSATTLMSDARIMGDLTNLKALMAMKR